jgi:acyl-CoA reductase-like NAD-dependent aldehyde dehydrogenase
MVSTMRARRRAARKAQRTGRKRPLAERIALVKAGVARLGAMATRSCRNWPGMMGRPVRYGGEFGGVNERVSYMAEIAEEALAPIDRGQRRLRAPIVREPHGVVFVIAPWNYPYMTAINTVAPALIAGNTVVLKHATQTLLVGERMAEAFQRGGCARGRVPEPLPRPSTHES